MCPGQRQQAATRDPAGHSHHEVNDAMLGTHQAFADVRATFDALTVLQFRVDEWRSRRKAIESLSERVRFNAEYGQLRLEWTVAFHNYTVAQRRFKEVLRVAWQTG